MTLKLSHEQAQALYNVLLSVIAEKPAEPEQRLVIMMLVKAFRKLRAKLEARCPPRGYSIGLSDEEAVAYYAYFQLNPLPAGMIYENNFITGHLAEINQQFI